MNNILAPFMVLAALTVVTYASPSDWHHVPGCYDYPHSKSCAALESDTISCSGENLITPAPTYCEQTINRTTLHYDSSFGRPGKVFRLNPEYQKLEKIYASGNQWSFYDFTNLAEFPHLKYFEFYGSHIGSHTLGDHTVKPSFSMRHLVLCKVRLSHIPFPPIARYFPNLEVLDLSLNGLTDSYRFSHMSETLRKLDLSQNRFTNLNNIPWKGLLHGQWMLRELDLSHNSIHTIPFGIMQTWIDWLDLSYNKLDWVDISYFKDKDYHSIEMWLEGNPGYCNYETKQISKMVMDAIRNKWARIPLWPDKCQSRYPRKYKPVFYGANAWRNHLP